MTLTILNLFFKATSYDFLAFVPFVSIQQPKQSSLKKDIINIECVFTSDIAFGVSQKMAFSFLLLVP